MRWNGSIRVTAISLTRSQIDAALPLIKVALTDYLWLQQNRTRVVDVEYRRRFNRFYRVRRSSPWQDQFYALLEANKRKRVTFGRILDSMFATTGRYEASFASKLVATIDPTMPVIDSIVLGNLKLRLPARTSPDRPQAIKKLHSELKMLFAQFLSTGNGRYLVRQFEKAYPHSCVTEVKMLDLVLWKTRSNVQP